MSVTQFQTFGNPISFSDFRTVAVGTNDSVSMSKILRRDQSQFTNETSTQYIGSALPWNFNDDEGNPSQPGFGGSSSYFNNGNIPQTTSSNTEPETSLSDFYGCIPWFWNFAQNVFTYSTNIGTTYIEWDNVIVVNSTSATATISWTTANYTYYRGIYAQNYVYPLGGAQSYVVGRLSAQGPETVPSVPDPTPPEEGDGGQGGPN